MCGHVYAIAIWGKMVGGECMVRVNAPICRSESWPVFYWWLAYILLTLLVLVAPAVWFWACSVSNWWAAGRESVGFCELVSVLVTIYCKQLPIPVKNNNYSESCPAARSQDIIKIYSRCWYQPFASSFPSLLPLPAFSLWCDLTWAAQSMSTQSDTQVLVSWTPKPTSPLPQSSLLLTILSTILPAAMYVWSDIACIIWCVQLQSNQQKFYSGHTLINNHINFTYTLSATALTFGEKVVINLRRKQQ